MQQTFMYNNTPVSYSKYGSGQPVVLLHGFAEDGTVWNKQVEALRAHCLLIVPDLPGSGNSPLFAAGENETISMDAYADCIHALIEHEQLHGIILLGHSMGGYITLAYAEKYPSQLKGFGLLHSTAFADSVEKKEVRKKGIRMIDEYGAAAFVKSTTPNLFAAPFKRSDPAEIEALVEQGKQFTDEALIQYYRGMMERPDRTAVLKNSNVPVLFIIGSDDVAAPLNDLLQQVSLPNVAYVHVLKNVGHMGMWEAAADFNKYVIEFVNDVTHT